MDKQRAALRCGCEPGRTQCAEYSASWRAVGRAYDAGTRAEYAEELARHERYAAQHLRTPCGDDALNCPSCGTGTWAHRHDEGTR